MQHRYRPVYFYVTIDNSDFFVKHFLSKSIDLEKDEKFPEGKAEFQEMNLENFQLEEKFDVIVIDNVLEHLKSPLILLEKLKNNLTPNGVRS